MRPSLYAVANLAVLRSPCAVTSFILPKSSYRRHTFAPSVAFRGAPTSTIDVFANTRLFGKIFKDLDDAEDFDPEVDDDEEGTKTKQLLQSTLSVLEKFASDDTGIADIIDEVFSKEEAVAVSSVPRKPVLSDRPDETGLFTNEAARQWALSKAQEEEIDDALDKDSLRRAIPLIKEILECAMVKPKRIEYATYDTRHPEFRGVELSQMMKMMDGVPPLEYIFTPKKFLRVIRRVTWLQLGMALHTRRIKRAKTAVDKYRAVFSKGWLLCVIPNLVNLVPLPKKVYNLWKEDKEVARQFLAGVNPVMIKVVRDVDVQVPRPMQSEFGSEKLKELAGDKRLFYVSYDDMAELEVNPHMSYPQPPNPEMPNVPEGSVNEPRFFHAPIALFELDEARSELDILGIQLDRESVENPEPKVYTRGNSTNDEWLYVKACLTSADTQMHEWVSHLGKTHFTMEPHIIAIHNTLKQTNHPVYTFLKPLMKDTLFLNWAGRQTLASFGANSFGDYMTSVGCGQFMQLINKYWKDYSFFQSSALPLELESRGFDENFNMTGYLYREDGMKLWNAYGNFATDFVSEIYASDSDVENDKDLAAWAKETVSASNAYVKGFPPSFKDKKTLAYTLQTLCWVAGGLHAAVNYPQYEFYAYAANKPFHLRGDIPTDDDIGKAAEEDFFNNTLPDINRLKETLNMMHLLTLPSDHCIDDLANNFAEIGTESYEKFVNQLDDIGDTIERRNRRSWFKRKPVYSYLNPSVVPASIDI